jgi:hypothetical protein
LVPSDTGSFDVEWRINEAYTVFNEDDPTAHLGFLKLVYGQVAKGKLGDPDGIAGESAHRQLNAGVHYSELEPETAIYFSKPLTHQQIVDMQTLPWSEVASLVADIATGKDSQESSHA